MAAENFAECLVRVLKHEGGYSNHPNDPGGPTMYGITINDVRKYVKPDASAADVKNLSLDIAKKIYKEKYWDAVSGDDLPSGIDYAVFDFGVNSGVSRSAKYLQTLVGVTTDGIIGPITLAAASKKSAATVAAQLCDARLAFLKGIKTWPTFGAGWGRRVAEVRAYSIQIAGRPLPDTSKSEPAPKSIWDKVKGWFS